MAPATRVHLQSRAAKAWAGARATVGVTCGCHYWEATVRDDGFVRVGWSTRAATLELGMDKQSFGYGKTGVKCNNKQFEPYGEVFGEGDVIGARSRLTPPLSRTTAFRL